MVADRSRACTSVDNRCVTMKLDDALNQLKANRKARRLRNLWPVIEAKLADGVTHAEILGLLNASGFQLTERTYKSYVYRIRKRRRTSGQLESNRVVELAQPNFDAGQPPIYPTSAPRHAPKRPGSFDFDPSGLSPDLLK
jgi:hypothetical protein